MMEAAEVQAACDRMCDAEARLGGPKFQVRSAVFALEEHYGFTSFSLTVPFLRAAV